MMWVYIILLTGKKYKYLCVSLVNRSIYLGTVIIFIGLLLQDSAIAIGG